jgi:hypothetical protein
MFVVSAVAIGRAGANESTAAEQACVREARARDALLPDLAIGA